MSKERELLKETLSFSVLDLGGGKKLYSQIERLLAQPEPFTPDSKREPLSGEQRYVMYTASRATSIDAYMTGCRDTEKAHGIGV